VLASHYKGICSRPKTLLTGRELTLFDEHLALLGGRSHHALLNVIDRLRSITSLCVRSRMLRSVQVTRLVAGREMERTGGAGIHFVDEIARVERILDVSWWI
jgi:hypothetical protein